MPGIKIVVDSSADLPEEVVRELDITIVPLNVTFGSKTFLDTELSPEEFWRLAEELEDLPSADGSFSAGF